ncbi:hypothetical protein GCM10023223_39600 [Stackebrandtia albiflava]
MTVLNDRDRRPLTVHPTDRALGVRLLNDGVLRSLACDHPMVAPANEVTSCVCDPAACGWHTANLTLIGAGFRRYDVPADKEPDTIWVIAGTSAIPGIIYRARSRP